MAPPIAASTTSAIRQQPLSPFRSASRATWLSPYARSYVDRWQRLTYLEIPGTRAEAARTAVAHDHARARPLAKADWVQALPAGFLQPLLEIAFGRLLEHASTKRPATAGV